MPSRVLVHLPPPEPPRLVDRPPRRPARGEEFPIGWTVADYQLERGEFAGEEYAFEVWVIPLLVDEGPASADPAPGEAGSGDCSEQRLGARYARRRADPVWPSTSRPRTATASSRSHRRRHPRVARSCRRDPLGRGDGRPRRRSRARALPGHPRRPWARRHRPRATAGEAHAGSDRATQADAHHPLDSQPAPASMRLPRRLLVQANALGARDPLVRPAEAAQLRFAMLEAELAGDRLLEPTRAATGRLAKYPSRGNVAAPAAPMNELCHPGLSTSRTQLRPRS